MSSPDPSAGPAPAWQAGSTAVDGVLPKELLVEVLLLLPAKEVCRVRAVCPSWRSLTYDPIFVAAHAARRPGPLLAVPNMWGADACVALVELPGHVVKRIRIPEADLAQRVLCTRLNRVFVDDVNHSVSVLDPISGSVSTLPDGNAEDLACRSGCVAWFAFGQVASTGEYKLLRVIDDGCGGDAVCDIFTFGDEIGQWRQMDSPPAHLDLSCTYGVVVDGAAYFLFDHWQLEEHYIHWYGIEPGCIPSFNLETEEWSAALHGPQSHILEEGDGMLNYGDLTDRLMLGELKGFLVMVHCNDRTSTTNLWFLMDIQNCVWSKVYSIQSQYIAADLVEAVQPLFVLDEGAIILLARTGSGYTMQIYDPRTNTALNVLENRCCSSGVGIYTGSLLC